MTSTFKRFIIIIAILVISVVLFITSKKEIPLEVARVKKLVPNLQRLDAAIYAPQDLQTFLTAYQQARNKLDHENKKWVWFRRYDPIASAYQKLLRTGATIQQKVARVKKNTATAILREYQSLKTSAATLNRMTLKMNEGRLARKDLMNAEILLHDMQRLYEKGDYRAAQQLVPLVKKHLQLGVNALNMILFRYKNPSQIDQWIKWITATASESKRTRSAAIIVNKIDRQLTLYKNGQPVKIYRVGLGRNGLNTKLYAGDNATPEGRYRVVKKNPYSHYYKALLLDYPNKDDQHQFHLARQKGLIPGQAGIGNLIEIHGGGIVFMTRGCVAMENNDIDEIYNAVTTGTPVTIVGSIGYPQEILSAIAEI